MPSQNQRQRFGRAIITVASNEAASRDNLHSETRPCSIVEIKERGALVTVKFEQQGINLPQQTIPVIMHELCRMPLKVGDTGIALSCNRYLGGISGQGGGVADDRLIGNLAAYMFVPVSFTEWLAVNTDYLTVLTDISDNVYRTTPTRIFEKNSIIIEKINELALGLNATNLVVNAEHDSALRVDFLPLSTITDNPAQEN